MISSPLSRGQLIGLVLCGTEPLPSNMYIAQTCVYRHGVGGKTLRYKTNHACIQCAQEAENKHRVKKFKPRNSAALHAYEERMERENLDPDPLFD